MSSLTRVNEKVGVTVGNGNTESVVTGANMADYDGMFAVARADSAHDYDMSFIREGFDDSGVYGDTDAGPQTTESSGGNQISVIPVMDIESPELNLNITNNDSSSHDYDVYVGGYVGGH